MKANVIFILGMILSVITFGQNDNSNSREEIKVIPPTFLGAEKIWQGKVVESIDDFLAHNIEYPQEPLNCGLQGTEVIRFVVSATGELTDYTVINSVCNEIDKEVIRVLETTNCLWTPASVNGEPIAMQKEVSLVFKLHKNNDFRLMAKSLANRGNKLLFVKKDPKKALKYFNQGIRLTPNEESLLIARSICNFKLGNEEAALEDWDRIMTLNYRENHPFETINRNYNLSDLKRFAEIDLNLEE